MPLGPVLTILHIVSAAFVVAPLYNLAVASSERARFGPTFSYDIDRALETHLRRGTARALIYQFTAFATGALALVFGPFGIEALWRNPFILAKFVLFVILIGLVHAIQFGVQRRIDMAVNEVAAKTGATPAEFSAGIESLRRRRAIYSGIALFLSLVLVIFGALVRRPLRWEAIATLVAIVALFSFRAHRSTLRRGWF